MHVELPLVGLFATLLVLLNVVMLALYRRINPCFEGVGWWIGALLLWAVCYLLFSLRLAVDSAWLTIFLPNLLCLASGTCSVVAVCRFRAQPFPAKVMLLLLAPTVLVFSFFVFQRPDFLARTGVMAACMGCINALIAWRLLVPRAAGHELSHRAAAVIHGILGLNEFVRMARALSLPMAGEGIPADPVILGSLLVNSLLVTPFGAFACALLMGQRQVTESRRMERELQEARVRLAEQEVVRQKQTLLRDLHDGLSGTITAIALNCRHLSSKGGSDHDEEVLRAIRQLAAMSNHEIRSMMRRVGSEPLVWKELQEELRAFAAALLQSSGIALEWQGHEPPPEPLLDIAAAASFTRMVKEALHNVLRHSGSRTAAVRWWFGPARLRVEIVDHGAGLDATKTGGRGLRHMSRRAEELGGTAEYVNMPPSGLSVCFGLPLPLALTSPAHDPHRPD